MFVQLFEIFSYLRMKFLIVPVKVTLHLGPSSREALVVWRAVRVVEIGVGVHAIREWVYCDPFSVRVDGVGLALDLHGDCGGWWWWLVVVVVVVVVV
jgi:hypothetical protein